jgi:ankyrin repeat protein
MSEVKEESMSRDEHGQLQALTALYEGNEARARELLPPDEELTAPEAAAFGRVERLRELLNEDPASVSEPSPDGFTPLHLAVFGGSPEAVRLLLERGADPNVVAESSIARVPPLGTATFVRRPDLAELLLDGGADVNGLGDGRFTALDSAVQNEDEPMIRLLLDRGADPKIGAGIARKALA